MRSKCISRPCWLGRQAGNPNRPFLMFRPRLLPTERILRVTCAEDSSNAMYKARLPLRQVWLAKCAATVDLPEPEVPDTNIDEPLKKPRPSSIVSRSSMPDEIRSLETLWSRRMEDRGKTEKPFLSIRKGYSSVP